jgi:hypothetical protein
VAKEKARHLFLQIDVSYIIVVFWEGVGMTKTHRKAHAAPPAAPARLRSTARPPGVATRVALADVDETRCCSSMDGDGPRSCSRSSRRHDDLEVRRRTSTPRQGLRHKRPRREDRGLQNQVLETPGLLCPREDSRGVKPAARRGASSHSSCPAALRARGAITWLLRRREALAVPGALALLPRPMGVHGMQATSRTCSASPRTAASR